MTLSPFLRWSWGVSITSLFAWSWLVLWGLMPGTPAADEVAVDADVRFSLEREGNGPLAGVLPGFEQVRVADLERASSLTVGERGDWSIFERTPNLRRLRIVPSTTWVEQPQPLSALSPLTELEALTFSRTRIESFDGLPVLSHLTDLSARETPLQSLSGIEHAPAMRNLDLALREQLGWLPGNALSGRIRLLQGRALPTAPLAALTQLESLNLVHRDIRSIEHLTGLRRLRTLQLSYNNLIAIEGLEQLTELRRLEVDHNQIADLSPLLALTKLEEVALMGNPTTEANVAVYDTLRERGVTILDAPTEERVDAEAGA